MGVLAVACAPAAPEGPPRATLPETSGTLAVAGLAAPVRVVRDRSGVPHIYAESEHDLFFAQGFVQAQDRLFQMDLWRRAANGLLAGVLGANFAERDAMTRQMQPTALVDHDGEADWAVLGPETRRIAEAFVAGVNAWVGRSLAAPPEEFRLAGWAPAFWRPEDLLTRTDAFRAASNARAEVLRANIVAAAGAARAAAWMPLDPPVPLVVPAGLDPSVVSYRIGDTLRSVGTPPFFLSLAAPFEPAASNAWAVNGSRSASGRPLLASDPHRAFLNPSAWYLVHLHAPGWNVIGATEPWAPGVAVGHNERVAWGIAAFDADVQDLYVERVNPDNPLQVQTPNGWTDVRRVPGVVPVKGRIEPFRFDHDVTPHGIVVATDRDRHLEFALRWAGIEPGAAPVLASLGIDRAASAEEFRQRLAAWKTPARTFVVADVGGHVGLQAAGLVPIRRNWTGVLPVPGWTGRFEWSGWHTLDELPHAHDPDTGLVFNANERPPSVTARSAIGFEWPDPARANRLGERLAAASAFSRDDFAALQHDVAAWNAGRLLPLVERLQAGDPAVERARRMLAAWDRRVTADSAAATLYVAWEHALARRLIAPLLSRALADSWLSLVGSSGNVLVPALTQPTAAWFGNKPAAGRDALLLEALATAVDEVASAAGGTPEADTWGRRHVVTFEHPLALTPEAREHFNVGPFPLGGYANTVMASGGSGLAAEWGPSFRQVIDVGDWDRSLVSNAPGQSEWPASPHFKDQAGPWAAGGYLPLPFTDAAVASAAADVLMLR